MGIHFEGTDLFLFGLIDNFRSAIVRDMVNNAVVAAAGIGTVFMEKERHDILFFGIKQDAGFAIWRNFINFTVSPRCSVEIPRRIKFQRPDIFVSFVEEGCRRCRRISDFINQSVGSSASVECIVGSNREAVNRNFG